MTDMMPSDGALDSPLACASHPISSLQIEPGSSHFIKEQDNSLSAQLARLCACIEEIGERRDFSARIVTLENDACASLTSAINDMLDKLDAERMRTEEQLQNLALHDVLTGLANRRSFQEYLQRAVARAERHDEIVAVILIDLDHFKEVNDLLGHDVGDQLLLAVSQRLLRDARAGDLICRIGGDEYAIILPDLDYPQQAEAVVLRLQESFTHPFVLNEHECEVTASIGISLFPSDGLTIDALFRNADVSLYAAKAQGDNYYRFFSPAMEVALAQRSAMSSEFRRAIAQQEFIVYFQPQLELLTGGLIGTEALLRWQHPERGLLAPEIFIPFAEELGIIGMIDVWVMRTACMQHMIWRKAGAPPLRLALNVSAKRLQDKDYIPQLLSVLAETGFPAADLELEIQENTPIRDWDHRLAVLRELSNHGVRIAVDDFGSGYCSIRYLKKFPVQTLKIDGAFIQNLTENPQNSAIASSMISLASALGISVVAEKVETPEQLATLRRLNCDNVQGFLLGQPLPADEFLQILFK